MFGEYNEMVFGCAYGDLARGDRVWEAFAAGPERSCGRGGVRARVAVGGGRGGRGGGWGGGGVVGGPLGAPPCLQKAAVGALVRRVEAEGDELAVHVRLVGGADLGVAHRLESPADELRRVRRIRAA